MSVPKAVSSTPAGRINLIEAALSCMADEGQSGTTVRAVTERAGVTPALVKHHFGNKEGLLVEAYRHLNRMALDRIEGATELHPSNLESALRGAIKALFPEEMSDVSQMRVLVSFWGLVQNNPRFAAVQAETNAEMREMLVKLLSEHAPETEGITEIAEGIIALTDGLWLECCMNPDRMSPARAMQIAIDFSRRGLND